MLATLSAAAAAVPWVVVGQILLAILGVLVG